MTESTEIERAADRTPVSIGAQIGDLDAAYRLSKALALAAMMPDALRGKPNDVLALMLYGQDLGLSPMQAIQGIYVVKGKPQISGQLWIALARRAGHKVFVPCRVCGKASEQHPEDGDHQHAADHDATRCTITIIRGDTGAKHSETFTIEDAQRAKLASKDVWQQYPKRMLIARATSDCCRVVCPEIALGFYAWGDEMSDEPSHVVVEQVVDEAVDVEIVESGEAADEIKAMAAQFNFAAETGESRTTPELGYECVCGAVGEHFEDDCPKAAADA